MSCQGLNYFIRNDIESIKKTQQTPVTFLIPGRLDYYNFKMVNSGVQNSLLGIELTASNFFVRLFAAKMKIKYDATTGRLLYYEGVSNLTKKDGSTQDVFIEYEYEI